MVSVYPFTTLSNTQLAQLVSQQLVGMLIIVLVKKELRQFFSGGKTDYVSAGIGGVLVRDLVLHLSYIGLWSFSIYIGK